MKTEIGILDEHSGASQLCLTGPRMKLKGRRKPTFTECSLWARNFTDAILSVSELIQHRYHYPHSGMTGLRLRKDQLLFQAPQPVRQCFWTRWSAPVPVLYTIRGWGGQRPLSLFGESWGNGSFADTRLPFVECSQPLTWWFTQIISQGKNLVEHNYNSNHHHHHLCRLK